MQASPDTEDWRPGRRLRFQCLLLVFVIAATCRVSWAKSASNGGLTLDLDSSDGSYKVYYNSVLWLNSSVYAVRRNGQLLTSNTGLKLSNVSEPTTATDAIGHYEGTKLTWSTADGDFIFYTTFKVYSDVPAIVFEQHFPNAVDGCSNNLTDDVITAFPSFDEQNTTTLNYLTYDGVFPSMHVGHWNERSDLPEGSHGGIPLVLFNNDLATVVMSPMNNFMVGVHVKSKSLKCYACGIFGTVESIPEDFYHRTLLYADQGVQQTMYNWGSLLLRWYGKTRTPLDTDFSIKWLGWWTDNGGYYHYNTETGKNYEQTMLDAKAKLEQLKIPARYFQFDSWWYFKDGDRGPVTLWEPRPDVFPDGMSDWLGLPLALHNRWFAPHNNYSSSWFITESMCALPASESLFDYIMGKAKKWGMFMYEQDWLVTTFDKMKATKDNVNNAYNWLAYMSNAAAKLNVTIQYCMPLPSQVLQTVAFQPVTQARGSGDYSPGKAQWKIGGSSLLYYSIGLVPFKDCFFTVPTEETGCPHKPACTEPSPTLQALVSTLSTGPIAPADGIQFMNEYTVQVLQRTCRFTDGLILKPDRPAVPLDAIFREGFSTLDIMELWHTLSSFPSSSSNDIGTVNFHYILAADAGLNFTLKIEDLGEPSSTHFVAYDYSRHCNLSLGDQCNFTRSGLHSFDKSNPLNIHVPKEETVPEILPAVTTHYPFRYWIAAPILPNGWAMLGEGLKFVVASKQRFTAIRGDAGQSLQVSLVGSSGEKTTVYFLSPGSESTVISTDVMFDSKGAASIECKGQSSEEAKCTVMDTVDKERVA